MGYKSYYKEEIYLAREEDKSKIPDYQHLISERLDDNSAVGIMCGYYDKEEGYSVTAISRFLLNPLGYSYDEFEDETGLKLKNIIWPVDTFVVDGWENENSLDFFHRLRGKNNQSVWVQTTKRTSIDSDGRKIWIASVRPLDDIINTILRDKSLKLIGMLDLVENKLTVQKKEDFLPSMGSLLYNMEYEEVFQNELANTIYPEYQESFSREVSIENIKKQLEKKGEFETTVPQEVSPGKVAFIRRKYKYFNEGRRFAFFTMEDVTSYNIYDSISSTLNYRGFLLRGREMLSAEKDDKYLILFDICNFKVVNRMYGYNGGDVLLLKMSQILKEAFKDSAIIARSENDHFICLVDSDDFDKKKIIKLCKQEVGIEDKKVTVHMQCGAFHITEENRDRYALYEMCNFARIAKSSISRNYSRVLAVYRESMSDNIIKVASIINGIDEAVSQSQLKVFYQPIFDARTGRIAAAEALVRWEHPVYGFLAPDKFIPLLENHRLIGLVDVFVVQKTDAFLRRRIENGRSIVPISINLSGVDFTDRNVFSKFHEIVNKSPVDNYYYRIEITESAFLDFSEEILSSLKYMSDNGIRVLMDDFGSGFSSFSNMASYCFNYLKLDKSFCDRMGESERNDVIVRNIINLGHSLGSEIVAEGVETQAQYEKLREWGCDFIQGYYFSKPVREDEFEKMLDEQR